MYAFPPPDAFRRSGPLNRAGNGPSKHLFCIIVSAILEISPSPA